MRALRLHINVMAGVIPGQPIPEHTRQWRWVTGNKELKLEGNTLYVPEGAPASEVSVLYNKLCDDAAQYMRSLQSPNHFNWVRCEWLWL
jgi:hypothetical protein